MSWYTPGDIFIVQKLKTWVGMFFDTTIENSQGKIMKLIWRDSDIKFTKRPHESLAYDNEDLPGVTKIAKLKRYQIQLLRQTLKHSLECGQIDNLEYIEALSQLKKYGNYKTRK